MDTNGLRENFQNQLKEIDEKIAQINGELEKAKEYKLKLLGGLETLELLTQNSDESEKNKIHYVESPEPTEEEKKVEIPIEDTTEE